MQITGPIGCGQVRLHDENGYGIVTAEPVTAITEADEAELAARGAGVGLSGRLRVSAATTFALLHVAGVA